MVDRPDTATGEPSAMLREEIALSWKRSLMSGLLPSASIDDSMIGDVDRRSRLLEAATPILDRMEEDLGGTGFCVLLADRDARLVDLRFGKSGMQDLMAEDGAVRGRQFVENTTGTNSIATVFETRTPLAVRGTEHYVEAMKKFSCYGYPLTHPVTRRLEGVLDITFLAEEENPLLLPMLRHAADDVQRRLLEGARESEKQLLEVFQDTVARRRGAPVIALADDVLLANASAQGLLDMVDHAVLRSITAGSTVGVVHTRTLTVNSGMTARAQWVRVNRAGGVVIEFETPSDPTPHTTELPPRNDTIDERVRRIRHSRTSVLVRGESGTGRTTFLSQLAPREDTVLFDASDPGPTSAGAWLAGLRAALTGDSTLLVVVENIHLLPDPIARRVSEIIDDSTAWFAFTTVPGDHEKTSTYRQLSLKPATTIELQPLRERRDKIPALVRTIAAAHDLAGDGTRFTPAALSALAARPWPGNLSELRDVVKAAVEHRSVGDIGEQDVGGRQVMSAKRLTRLQLAERAAIEAVLAQYGGNKSDAAAELGISRTTLYKRMKSFGLLG